MGNSRPLMLILIVLVAIAGYLYLSQPLAQPGIPPPAPSVAPTPQ